MNNKCKCGLKLEFIKTPTSVHFGKLVCPKHGFAKWKAKEETKKKRSNIKFRPTEIVWFRMKIRTPFCFFCLRKKDQLGINETLEVDHIIELSKGGDNKIENCQVLCSACHKLKNWARLYMNWHLSGIKQSDVCDTKTTAKSRV